MINKTRKYFSFFGILAATVNIKLQSFTCMIHAILVNTVPKINNIILLTQLKTNKLHSKINN
jgi:hypothetical protein